MSSPNIIIIGKDYQQKLREITKTISIEIYPKDFKNIRDIIDNYINIRNILTRDVNYIIIHNSNKLPKPVQYLLRAILERNVKSCRFIFLTETLIGLIEPLQSRCSLQYCDSIDTLIFEFHRDKTLSFDEKFKLIQDKLKMK